jgi:hypothetical protein
MKELLSHFSPWLIDCAHRNSESQQRGRPALDAAVPGVPAQDAARPGGDAGEAGYSRIAISLLATVALFVEYEAICQRAEHRQAAGLSRLDTKLLLDGLAVLVEEVEAHFLLRRRLRDANGRADAVVTFNHRDHGEVPAEFGIGLMLPRDVLKRITT